jgi:hypothetical protein
LTGYEYEYERKQSDHSSRLEIRGMVNWKVEANNSSMMYVAGRTWR